MALLTSESEMSKMTVTLNNEDEQAQQQEHHHSLPDYPDMGGGTRHLIASVNTTEANKDLSSPFDRIFELRTVFGPRALKRAHIALTFSLAVALVAVSIQNASNKHQLSHNAGSSSAAFVANTDNPVTPWAPLPDPETTLHAIAFGSCMKEDMPQPYWDTLVEIKPQVTILGGDNVYMTDVMECQEPECLDLEKAYARLESHPSFQGAKRVLPMVAQLDDHDYGQNDGWKTNPFKDKAKELFLDWLQEPQDSERRRENEGLYTYYEWGPLGKRVQLILLDTRYSRSGFQYDDELWGYVPDHEDKSKRMLSHAQWQWLEHEVLARPANVRLVFSTVQVLSEGEWGFEGWNKIPHELQRLKKLVHQTCHQAENPSLPIFLSGDRHMGAYYYDAKYDLYDVTASSFTHTIPAGFDPDGLPCEGEACIEPDAMRMGEGADGIVWVNHFGMVNLHWTQKRVEVNLVRAETSPGHPAKTKWEQNTDAGQVLKRLSLDIP